MPTVPVYGGQKVQTAITPNAQFNPNAPAEAFNLGASRDKLERAQSELVGSIGKIAKESIDKANKIRLLDFDSKLSQLQTKLEYGVNGQGGLYSKKGLEAAQAGEPIAQEWTKETDKLLGELSNEEQKTMAKERVANRWANINDSIQKHTFSELQKHDVQVTENFLKNSQNEAAENFTKPDRIAQNLTEQKEVLLDFGKRQGWDKETLDLKLAEAMNKTHALVISKFADSGLDSKAKEYYEAHKNEITGEAENHILKMLRASTIAGESQRAAEAITLHAKGPQDALAQLKDIDDPEIKDATRKRIREHYEDQQWAKRMNSENLNNYAEKLLFDANGNMDAVPRSVLSQMDARAQKGLDDYSKFLRRGEVPITDWSVYSMLHDMASNPETREKFADLDLMQYRGKLSDEKFSEIIKLRDAARKGDGKTLDAVLTKKQIVDAAIGAAGVDIRKNATDYFSAVKNVDAAISEWQQANGRKMTSQELRKFVEEQTTEAIIGKRWFGLGTKKKAKFEMTPEEKQQAEEYQKSLNQTPTATPKPSEIKVINGQTYRKVPGGWQKVGK